VRARERAQAPQRVPQARVLAACGGPELEPVPEPEPRPELEQELDTPEQESGTAPARDRLVPARDTPAQARGTPERVPARVPVWDTPALEQDTLVQVPPWVVARQSRAAPRGWTAPMQSRKRAQRRGE
jgi:hypothetical protein